MKVITLSEVASRLRQRRQGRGYLGKFINECTIEDAIPLDKVKQAREEIIATNDSTLAIVEILDNLIAESEN